MSLASAVVFVAAIFFSMAAPASAYLPGIAERFYNTSDPVPVRVNTLRSLSTLLPYNYYHLPFCRPAQVLNKEESLGEIVWGDRVMSSLYTLNMRVNVTCKIVPCPDKKANNEEVWKNVDVLERFITEGYRAGMSIDNLPMFLNQSKNPIFNGRCTGLIPAEQRMRFARGYAIGVHKACKDRTIVNNHLHFEVQFHEVPALIAGADGPRFSVVGFTGVPYSVKHSEDGSSCNELFNPLDQDVVALTTDDLRMKVPVWWTYSVRWTRNDAVSWGTRWDAYLSTSLADSNTMIHWVNIVSSIAATLSLSTVVLIILTRALHRDIARYNARDPESQEEEVGWKLVHADVFRPPPRNQMLAGLVGNGMQIVFLSGGILLFTLLGTLSPANRGSLLTAFILLFVLLSLISGYVCAHLLKLFDKREWKWVIACGGFFPTVTYVVFFVTNLVNYHAGATTAVPFTQFFTLFLLWIFISMPLTILGGAFAFHEGPLQVPLKVGKLAREVPAQPWFVSAPFVYVVPPLVPLGAAFLELKFILSSLWLNMVYYVFGFLALVGFVWTITVVLTTVIVVYYRLCSENYRWWWASFIVPAGLGVHVFAYSIYYYSTELHIDTASGTILYFAYMGLFSLGYGLAAGAIGFVSAFIFVKKIYSSIKID